MGYTVSPVIVFVNQIDLSKSGRTSVYKDHNANKPYYLYYRTHELRAL